MKKLSKQKKINKMNSIPVVILCGGRGTRIQEETQVIPKPLIKVGERPILWHIMKIYSKYGFNKFILLVGYKGEKIKEYFYNYPFIQSDFTVHLNSCRKVIFHAFPQENWEVTIIDTGLDTMTGARLKKVEKFIPGETFMLTYGDGVANIDIKKLLNFHFSHGKTGTVTGVHPLPRFGELTVNRDKVIKFGEKPMNKGTFINGGFFVFNRRFFKYLSSKEDCYLEREPLEKLALDNQLMAYVHKGFWQCMDTQRDLEHLNKLWNQNKAFWKVW